MPDDWAETVLGNADASVEMANPNEDGFLLLIIEPKDDFFGWNMTRFVYVTIGQGVGALDLPELSEIEYSEVDGRPAATAVLSGAAGGQQFKYLRVAIDAPGHWVQVVLGSLRSAWESNETVFHDIVGSLDLLPR